VPFLEPGYLFSVFLVFVRIGGLMVAAPFFGHQSVPVRVKIPLAVLLAYTIVGLVPGPLPAHVAHPVGLMLAVAIEALTGILLGFAAQFVFWAVAFAGELIGFQMGLSLATVYNPAEGVHSNPIGRFLVMSMLLVFLLLDGHHQVLRALVASFAVVPLSGADLSQGGPLLLTWTGAFFGTALRLAAPFMITMFLIDVAFGVFARIAPQADLFSLGFPVKLLVGLGLTFFFLQNFMPVLPDLIQGMYTDVLAMIEALVPGR
jgi:flagellar biosynthetic protein FliR